MPESQLKIFVQIASYRDPECQWTIKDLFEKAAFPDRVHVGICWQFDAEKDMDCFVEPSPRPGQTRVSAFTLAESRGVCWARSKAQALFADETYVLMIDSHMRFIPGWDSALICELARCDSPKPFLSSYPPGYMPPDELQQDCPAVVLRAINFDANHDIRFDGEALDLCPDKPLRGAFLAAGFLFAPSDFLREVPYDPHFEFNQEEVTLAARAFTHGWDVFSPTIPCVYHHYGRDHLNGQSSAWHWAGRSDGYRRAAAGRARFNHLLCGLVSSDLEALKDLDQYGLGTARNLAAYEGFCGIDFRNRTLSERARTAQFITGIDRYRAPDRAQALLMSESASGAAGTHIFLLEDDAIVFSEPRQELHALNTSAAVIWCLMEEGMDTAAIARELQSRFSLGPADANEFVVNALADWSAKGLLAGDPGAEPARPPKVWSAAPDLPPYPEDPPPFAAVRTFHLLDTSFQLRASTLAQMNLLLPVMAHLASGDAQATHCIDVVPAGAGTMIYRDGIAVDVCATLEELVPMVYGLMWITAVRAHRHLLNIHAGVVGNADGCILLPAPPGSGKTTLTAALVADGFDYYSDEVALLDADGLRVQPFPQAFCIKKTGVAAIAPLFPEVTRLPLHLRKDGKQVAYLCPPLVRVPPYQTLSPVLVLIFPKYQPGADLTCERLSPSVALGRLLDQCMAIDGRFDLSIVQRMVDWIKGRHCHAVTYGTTQAGVVAVRALTTGH